MVARRWTIWKRGSEDGGGIVGPSTAIDLNRAEKVEVVEAQHVDALLTALQDEVERLRKMARSMNSDPHWAGRKSPVSEAIEAQAERLQKILDAYGGGKR